VKPLRYLGFCQNGININADAFGKGSPFLSYSDVYKNDKIPLKLNGLVQSNEKDKFKFSILKGDVFFTRTSETMEEIGIASTCLQDISNAVFAGFLIRFRPIKGALYSGFAQYFFRSKIHRRFFVKEMNLVTRASLSQELLKKLPVLLPPLEEQQQIVDYIEKEMERINTKIDRTKKLIELLKEYRTALISEVVTGKVKVMP
jgi:type I restriction enzyme S subunit